jgi:hypothetical protein
MLLLCSIGIAYGKDIQVSNRDFEFNINKIDYGLKKVFFYGGQVSISARKGEMFIVIKGTLKPKTNKINHSIILEDYHIKSNGNKEWTAFQCDAISSNVSKEVIKGDGYLTFKSTLFPLEIILYFSVEETDNVEFFISDGIPVIISKDMY